ncbi:MAG TPA: DUF5994 family protein [Mycobacterium sp.]|nr:DUF5994 family protein [Mycobacterium sp.]
MVQIVSQRSSARLAFCDRSALPGAVDGAWWPNTRDLREELPDLVAVVSLLIGPVHRVVYDPSMWPEAPSRIIRGTAVISVDPYAMVARDTIYLVGTHARNSVLYVVPPSSPGDVVHRVLRAVADAIHPMSAPVLRHLVEHFTKAPERSAP